MYIKKVLTEGQKDKSAKMEKVTSAALTKIYQTVVQKISSDFAKKSPKSSCYDLSKLIEKMSMQGMVGLIIGQDIGGSLMKTFWSQSISQIVPKSKKKEFESKIKQEYNKIARMKNF